MLREWGRQDDAIVASKNGSWDGKRRGARWKNMEKELYDRRHEVQAGQYNSSGLEKEGIAIEYFKIYIRMKWMPVGQLVKYADSQPGGLRGSEVAHRVQDKGGATETSRKEEHVQNSLQEI